MRRVGGGVFVAGGDTLVGAALRRTLGAAGMRVVPEDCGDEPDPTDAAAVDAFVRRVRPATVVVAAGPAGGIALNRRAPATLMRANLLVACHLLEAARRHGVARLLYLASSCAYPRDAAQPLRPDALGTGALEPTSEAYATAKLAGIRLVQAHRREHGLRWVAAVLPDTYGPGDDFDPDASHVVPALIRRFVEARIHDAPEVTLWGSGRPRRDFVFVDDVAAACRRVLADYDGDAPVNLGSGTECTIADLAETVRDVVGFRGTITFDESHPDGAPRKVLDGVAIAGLGWRPTVSLRDGLARTLVWWLTRETDGPAAMRWPQSEERV